MTSETIRHPAVAGRFYTAVPKRLRVEVQQYLQEPAAAPVRAFGVMVPHAGYMYSGRVCGRGLASVEVPPTVLLLHTKHQLGGGNLALAQFERWETPLGTVPVDAELNRALGEVPSISRTNLPHFGEHAAEVVLPFLQVLQPKLQVCVISVMVTPPGTLMQAGKAIGEAITRLGRDVLIVASSDMNHYADHDTTVRLDKMALEKLAAFDAAGLLDTCERYDITMCGAHATALMLAACKELGATRVEVLEHTTSGEVSGEMGSVVGYASARVL